MAILVSLLTDYTSNNEEIKFVKHFIQPIPTLRNGVHLCAVTRGISAVGNILQTSTHRDVHLLITDIGFQI